MHPLAGPNVALLVVSIALGSDSAASRGGVPSARPRPLADARNPVEHLEHRDSIGAPLFARWLPPAGITPRPAVPDSGALGEWRRPRRRRFATCAEARQHGAKILGGVGLLVGAVASFSPRLHSTGQRLAVIGAATVGGGLLGYSGAGHDPACTGEDGE